jgi:hypothetical protein
MQGSNRLGEFQKTWQTDSLLVYYKTKYQSEEFREELFCLNQFV